jgi:hypothetical protein
MMFSEDLCFVRFCDKINFEKCKCKSLRWFLCTLYSRIHLADFTLVFVRKNPQIHLTE